MKLSKALTIYFHIGPGKTGSTAIQAFLVNNRDLLFSEHSCLYPDIVSGDFKKGPLINHTNMFMTAPLEAIYDKVQKVIQYCEENSVSKLVFSDEALFQTPPGCQKVLHLVDHLLTYENVTLKAISYLRRQDNWLESAWSQWGIKMFDSIDEYVNAVMSGNMLDWDTVLDTWAGKISIANVLVGVYEKQQLPDGIISDFLAKVGIDMTRTNWNEAPKTDVNRENFGISAEVIRFLTYCKAFYKNVDDTALVDLLSKKLGKDIQRKPYEAHAILSPKKRLSVLAKMESVSNKIARKYLNREDGALFYDAWPDPNETWEPPRNLDVEILSKISATIINEQQTEINRLSERIRQIERFDNELRDRMVPIMQKDAREKFGNNASMDCYKPNTDELFEDISSHNPLENDYLKKEENGLAVLPCERTRTIVIKPFSVTPQKRYLINIGLTVPEELVIQIIYKVNQSIKHDPFSVFRSGRGTNEFYFMFPDGFAGDLSLVLNPFTQKMILNHLTIKYISEL